MLFAILFLTAVIFALMQAVLGDPVVLMLGRDADPETVARLRQDLGFDRPTHVQYLDWLGRLLRGDWGRSFRTSEPVLPAILARLPISLELTAWALGLALVLALALGILAAIRRDTPLDLGVSVLTGLGVAMPNFWIAILLILLFALQLRWLPSSGLPSWAEDPAGHLRAMLLPAVTLSAAYFANLARLTRARMLEALESDYVRTARAKGLSELPVLARHVVRNAAVPIVTVIGLGVALLIGGVVVTESVYSIPGLGRLTVDAVLARDYPTVQAVILLFSVVYVVINLLVDLSYVLLDPRIRY
jgi:peptide/nickel transport system permease protein